MKKLIVNVLATTGISLVLLSIVAWLSQAQCIYIWTVFQVLGVNLIAQSGLFLMSRLEMKYAIIEMFLDMALIVAILLASGSAFHWFASTPPGTLIFMGFVLYVLSVLLNLFSMRREAREINAMIKRREGK